MGTGSVTHALTGHHHPPSAGLWVAVSALALGPPAAPAALAAQQILQDCSVGCGLDLREVAVLGESEGQGYVGRPRGLVQRSDGVFVVTDGDDQHRIKFFAPDGSFLRSFGRLGQGPGEFQTVGSISLLPGDAVEIYDLGNRRFTAIGPDFTLGRISPAVEMVAPFTQTAPDGSRVVNAQSHLPDRMGLPLHWVTPELAFERSFGAQFTPGTMTRIENWRRPLATPTTRSVWAAHQNRYRLEEWGRDGELMRVLERRVPWLEPWDGTAVWEEGGKPRPLLRRIHLDAEGRIWTLVRVPGERWQDGLAPGTPAGGQARTVVVDEHALYDSVIEVIDPERGVVVRSQRFDLAFSGFSADGQVYALVEVEGGRDVRIAVWDLVEVDRGGGAR